MSSLKHLNIVKFCGATSNPIGIILEWVKYELADGRLITTLKPTHLNKSVLGYTRQLFCTCKDIADGLQYLHENLIAHRDLKPENVLIGGRKIGGLFTCKIADFGEARGLNIQTHSPPTEFTTDLGRGTLIF